MEHITGIYSKLVSNHILLSSSTWIKIPNSDPAMTSPGWCWLSVIRVIATQKANPNPESCIVGT